MKRIGQLPGPVLSEPSTHVLNGVAAVLAAPGRPTRHIDPEAGRWSSQLPLNFESCEVNLYRYVEPPQEHPDSAITPSLVQESETTNCDEMVVCYDPEGHRVSGLPDAAIGESSEYRCRYVWAGRERDAERDIQFNQTRCFDPTPGVWLGKDGQIVHAAEEADRLRL